jgi:ADP-heptose:LPS heptosyltransferase
LPGIADVITFDAPWVGYRPAAVDPGAIDELTRCVARLRPERAFVFTSSHQSPLPLALLLRLAGVPWIGATSVDYPGSLLDLRRRPDPSLHEVEQDLALVEDAGFSLAADDPGTLAVNAPRARVDGLPARYVVVHPGASVPARALPSALAHATVDALLAEGTAVVVTGTASETRAITRDRDPRRVVDVGGRVSFEELAVVLAHADAVVVGNTGPAHLAAAVGTPVVSIFAPVVPSHQWHPWGVPNVVLGDQAVPCAGCRSRSCPHQVQHCVRSITAHDVVEALRAVRHEAREVVA